MTKKIILLALCSLLFAPCSAADAQQPAKIPRIGFLITSSPSTISARLEAFRQALRELGRNGMGRTLALSIDMRREKLTTFPRLRLS